MSKLGPVGLRRILLTATWLAGTLLATAVGYGAVTAVTNQVTLQRSEELSQTGVDRALQRVSPSPQGSPPIATPDASSSPSPASSPQVTPNQNLPSPTTAAPQPTTTSRTFALVGGTANLSCTGGQISLNWATPNSGFWVETGSSDGGAQVEVRFRSDRHESRLEAWCAASQVQASVREEAS